MISLPIQIRRSTPNLYGVGFHPIMAGITGHANFLAYGLTPIKITVSMVALSSVGQSTGLGITPSVP